MAVRPRTRISVETAADQTNVMVPGAATLNSKVPVYFAVSTLHRMEFATRRTAHVRVAKIFAMQVLFGVSVTVSVQRVLVARFIQQSLTQLHSFFCNNITYHRPDEMIPFLDVL